MPKFFDLPRELRDMIYFALLTEELPRPSLSEVHWKTGNVRYLRLFDPEANVRGEAGNAYSLEPVPSTCCAFLQCSSRIRDELSQAIERAKSRARMPTKLDCLVKDERLINFTWLSFPLVHNAVAKEGVSKWSRFLSTYCQHPRIAQSHYISSYCISTIIHQLQVDIRLVGNRKGKWIINSNPPGRISWGICAALKHILENGPDFSRSRKSRRRFVIEELILNIMTPPGIAPDGFLPEDFPPDQIRDGMVHPKTVAKELLSVWNYIWSVDDYIARLYRVLIERIGRVRICIDENTWRTRELQAELERGQAERRRIAARVGW